MSALTAALGTPLWEFALLSYLSVLINLNPLMEFDGYYVVADGSPTAIGSRRSRVITPCQPDAAVSGIR